MPTWTKEQLDAINFDKSNIIVSAGAGSGKTAVLSERVIRKIKDGVHINELLILTFTNAAAKEMKERIRKKLKKEGFFDELNLIDSSYITTFDSYSLSILKKYHYLLNIRKDLKVVDNDLIIYKKKEILDDIFDEYYNLDNKLFNKLIEDFCTKDDDDIKKYILNISSKLDLIIDVDDYLNNYLNNYFNDDYLNKVIDDLNNNLIEKINIIKELLFTLSYYVDEKFNEKINESLKNLLVSNNYNDIKNNVEITLPRLTTDYEEAKIIKQEIKDEIDSIKKVCVFDNIDSIKENILSTKDYVSIIIDIIKKLNDRLNDFKFKNDLYEFSDIAKYSIKLLKENSDIRDEIKNSLNEIMVDEYQDTNDIQEEFISLISNNNVYMVGDIKQSIYRFRNANPYIFKNKYENYSKNNGGIKIDLNKNFRSREETLNNINKIFNLIMDLNIGGADYKLYHQMVFGNNTYNIQGKTSQNNNFEIYNYDYDKSTGFTREETEIFMIGNDIKEKINNKYQIFDKDDCLLRDACYSDFVILLDRAKDFTLYKKIFEYLNIPLCIYKDEKINDEYILMIIKNFLLSIVKIHNSILDEEFKHSFMSLLRSPVFEYDDSKIFDLFLNNDFKNDEVYKRLKSIEIDSLTVKELLNYIVYEFDIISSINRMGNTNSNLVILEYLDTYIDTKEELGFTIEDFCKYLDEIISNDYDIKFSSKSEDSNSVRIMTIHKSKGLEYSICYYAGLYKDFNIQELKDRFMFDNTYGIITPYFNEGIGETVYKYLIKSKTIKEEISEKIRLFYVALTRAKEKMIILADLNGLDYNSKNENGLVTDNIRINYRSFLDIIISIQDELKDYIIKKENTFITKEYEKITKLNFDEIIDKSNIKIDVKELNIDKSLIQKEHYSKVQNKLLTKEEINNIKYGLDVHKIFECEDFSNPKHVIVKKFLSIYDFKNAINIYKEYEFIFIEKSNEISNANVESHGIIDLMFEYEDYIDIIDYKLKNISDLAYKKQLEGYKKAIENKTSKKVNIYLYSILNNELKKVM